MFIFKNASRKDACRHATESTLKRKVFFFPRSVSGPRRGKNHENDNEHMLESISLSSNSSLVRQIFRVFVVNFSGFGGKIKDFQKGLSYSLMRSRG
jgi:hypothetical protein